MSKIKFNTDDLRDIASGLEEIEGAMQGMFATREARMALDFQPGYGSVIKVEAVYDGSSWETTLEMPEAEPESKVPPIPAEVLSATKKTPPPELEDDSIRWPVRAVPSQTVQDVLDRVEDDLIPYFEEMAEQNRGYRGTQHKLEEIIGALTSARDAAVQAEDGTFALDRHLREARRPTAQFLDHMHEMHGVEKGPSGPSMISQQALDELHKQHEEQHRSGGPNAHNPNDG